MADPQLTTAEREAARWLAVLDTPHPRKSDLAAFQAWLGADDAHKRAYEDVAKTSDRIDAFLTRAAANDTGPVLPRSPKRSARPLGWAAGGLAAACIAAFILVRVTDPFNAASAATYTTPIRHERLVKLGDGSQIEMAPGARLTVAFAPHNRRVRLDEGAALFNVSHDASRPFVVSTKFGDLRVTGTAFVVRIDDERATATVISGAVEAHPHIFLSLAESPGVLANGNAEIILSRTGVRTDVLTHDVIEQRLIWRERMVSLDGQSLRDAADDVGRFSGVQFVFADSATASIRLSGYISGDDVDGFLRLLQTNVGISATRRADGAIVLQRTAPT